MIERGLPGTATRNTVEAAQANLRIVLELGAAGGIRCSAKTQRPTAASTADLAARLQGGDFYPDEAISAYAWPLLVQAGGLAELSGTRLQLTARGRRALTDPVVATLTGLWHRWLSHAPIDEFSRIEAIRGQRSANTLSAVKPRRQAAAAALDLCDTDSWVDVDDLFTRMRGARLDPRIERNDRALWRLYLCEARYGSLGYNGHHDWALLQGRYTLAVLFEYAATLGIIDVTYDAPQHARDDFRNNWGAAEMDSLSRYDGLRAIRVNALGAVILGRTSHLPPATGPTRTAEVQVLPNADIVALGELPEGARLTINAFAEATSERVWALTTASLLKALATGRDVSELRHVLAESGCAELPATVSTMLDDVTARGQLLTDKGIVRLIECSDPATATLISNDPHLQDIVTLIGDHHLAVTTQQEPEFRRAVTKRGLYLR